MTNEERAKSIYKMLSELENNNPRGTVSGDRGSDRFARIVARALDEAEERGADGLRKQALFVLGMARQNESGEARLDGLRHAYQLVQNTPWKT